MELNHYRLIFINNLEFMVESEHDLPSFIKNIHNSGLFKANDYITLQLKSSEPLILKLSQLFSVQKIPKEALGAQMKFWRVV
jgi:hypothetical protein